MAFGFDVNKVSVSNSKKVDAQPTVAKRAEIAETPVIDNKVKGEFGDKLLEQVQPRFIQAAQIPAEDAVELSEMYAMAGIKNPKMPTAKQYASVAEHTNEVSEFIDKLTITNNAERLFESDAFKALDNLFGIS